MANLPKYKNLKLFHSFSQQCQTLGLQRWKSKAPKELQVYRGGKNTGNHNKHDCALIEECIECGRKETELRASKSQATNLMFLLPVNLGYPPVLSHPDNHLPHLFPLGIIGITAADMGRKYGCAWNLNNLIHIILFNPHHYPHFPDDIAEA